MNRITNQILDILEDDIVSHGLLVQIVNDDGGDISWKQVLDDILSRDVAIGYTELTSINKVDFIEWRGSKEQKLHRAAVSVETASQSDKEFAYWLCLKKNVDRTE